MSSEGSNSDKEIEQTQQSWVEKFCLSPRNIFFCYIDSEYLKSNFNFTGLKKYSKNFRTVVKILRDEVTLDLEKMSKEEQEQIENETQLIYGLLHARYIVTDEGMMRMAKKYQKGIFGKCPQVFCKRQPCLPIGRSDTPHKGSVKHYCPKCRDVYLAKTKFRRIDGAYFGTTFAHMLLNVHPQLSPREAPRKYVPKIFGFEIHPSVSPYQEDEEDEKEKNN
ncbi:casein kinase ii subunit beta [Anaeramoeba flamelloides]|uniref:Casein kinase II subunit beta n=1 Tax=Anaeramoeba flamelloides TaxID=1746091 RepID=A0ABQ8Z5V1_9EUKA|nr:casein kinase ii subunit beta [Anaeramoeba flamelloides]